MDRTGIYMYLHQGSRQRTRNGMGTALAYPEQESKTKARNKAGRAGQPKAKQDGAAKVKAKD